jgi:cardiolipin synthase A/B
MAAMRSAKAYHNGYSQQQEVELISGGKPYFDRLLQMVSAAQTAIHLQTYIYQHDATGILVADALMAAAQRGVTVYLLVDGYASQALPGHFIDKLRAAGIQFRFFEPLFKARQFYLGRRMHHKILVVDAQWALVGGINIADRYNDMPGERAWLDFALYVRGSIAQELCVLCWKTWNGFAAKMVQAPCGVPGGSVADGVPVRMRRNDWVRRKNEISVSYIEMLRQAQSHVVIVCSYFLPGKVIRRLLRSAAQRGVSVRVVTAGRSDVPLSKPAERWLYDWLLRYGIELYEFQPTVLHAKIAVCDGQWLTVGSYNVNNISAYASVELNLDVRHAVFATAAETVLNGIIGQQCARISMEAHKKNTNPFRQLGRWFSYQFIRAVFFLFTFYFKRRAARRP